MKRFYKDVTVEAAEGGWSVLLDGRAVKTPARRQQLVPGRTLAEALAAEWRDQGEEIDPARFVFRDHADYAIDIVAHSREETIEKLLGYGETDTLCYRADPEDALFEKQQECWEPLLAQVEERHGVRFVRISGIVHKPQPAETLDVLRRHLEAQDDFTLAGLTAMASLAASLTIALLASDEAVNDPMQLWRDANLEEEWQAELWGREEEAEERRAKRAGDFSAAQVFVMLARSRD